MMAKRHRAGVWQAALRTAAVGMGLALASAAHAQSSTHTTMPQMQQPGADMNNDPRAPKVPAEMQERMERARNDERQKRLISDTDKLLALATSLKQDVDKTDKNMLSVEVIRRTEEIEKLSHAIRERMKQ